MKKIHFLGALLFFLLFQAHAQFDTNILCKPGHFVLGCNYSNAGTQMWVDWKPEVIVSY